MPLLLLNASQQIIAVKEVLPDQPQTGTAPVGFPCSPWNVTLAGPLISPDVKNLPPTFHMDEK